VVPDPRIAVIPDRVRTAGPQIVSLARMAGIELDAAQRLIADATAGVDAQGKWVAFESVIFSPRQNIKTEFLLARILAGLFLFREDYLVYSSHQVKTSSKTFRRLKLAIDRNDQLGARIKRVSNRIGAEQIELSTGQVVEMVARSTNSGRGFTGNVVMLDEAHELDGDQLAAILPMLSTVKNPSVFYALSLGNEHTSHVAGLRARALEGKPDVCWIEYSMADDDDVADREVWKRVNPAYHRPVGHPARITLEYMEREYAALGPERFARERLGKSEWPSGEAGEWEVISQELWDAAASSSAELGSVPEPVAVAVVPQRRLEYDADGVPLWIRRRGQPAVFVGR
jgi:phage terminase large subunit-like protein